jgi:hypothetical protein
VGCRFESCWDRHSDWGPLPIWFAGFASKPIPAAEMSYAAPGGNSKSASSRLSGPGPYFSFSLGSLIGTCREVLTILGLPSGYVRLKTVSRSRMNFSASMCVASLMVAFLVPSLVPSRLEALNSITYPRAARSARPDRHRSAQRQGEADRQRSRA